MEKAIYYIAIIVGTSLGSYIPTLFGVGWFSLWSVLGSVVGGLLFLYIAYKFMNS